MINNPSLGYLNNLFQNTPSIDLKANDKYVIFSDLHMGNGRRNDDFLRNALLFKNIIEKYYYKNDYKLILNGDIEELQRFSLQEIKKCWRPIYEIFYKFKKEKRINKIYGNHDFDLFHLNENNPSLLDIPVLESIKLRHENGEIFILHGHQASDHYEKHHEKISFFLKTFANPLGIGNYTVAHNSKKRFYIEQRIHDFAKKNKIVAIIGHTHRPLFEALSKIDFLKYNIEELCRKYMTVTKNKKKLIESEISEYKDELESYSLRQVRKSLRDTLYAANIVIPCIFNSGCCIGKRGITALEITGEEIFLIHWFDINISKKYLNYHGNQPEQLDKTNYFRMVLKKDNLDYIFTRIKLLS